MSPRRKFHHEYHDSFKKAKRDLGLADDSFKYFWRDIEENLDDDPSNVYVKEVPDSGGFRVYPTAPEHEDFPSCVVYFSVEERPGEQDVIHYYGLEAVRDDWTYAPLN